MKRIEVERLIELARTGTFTFAPSEVERLARFAMEAGDQLKAEHRRTMHPLHFEGKFSDPCQTCALLAEWEKAE